MSLSGRRRVRGSCSRTRRRNELQKLLDIVVVVLGIRVANAISGRGIDASDSGRFDRVELLIGPFVTRRCHRFGDCVRRRFGRVIITGVAHWCCYLHVVVACCCRWVLWWRWIGCWQVVWVALIPFETDFLLYNFKFLFDILFICDYISWYFSSLVIFLY